MTPHPSARLPPRALAFVAGLLLAVAVSPALAAESPASLARGLGDAVTAHAGDLSLLVASATESPARQLRERPDSTGLVQVASQGPALRIHYAPSPMLGLADANLDGVPDRVVAAREAALAALRVCERLGLGRPADDGDGELDIYLVALGGLARGYTVVEDILMPSRGGYGFIVADPSSHIDDHAFRAMVARSVARLVLAASDASAPAWWSEASALWIEERANGTSSDIARALHERWSRPEIGLAGGMPTLLRGNAGLLWALDDPAREAAAMRATWRALANRLDATDPDQVVLDALEGAARLPLGELLLRAGMRQVVHGQAPSRWAQEIGAEGLSENAELWLGPRGAALVHLGGGDKGDTTRLSLSVAHPGWSATLIARRPSGTWERVRMSLDKRDSELLLPWADYEEAILLLAGPSSRDAGSSAQVGARHASRGALFGLASFAARRTPMDGHALQWESSWEDALFGWVVERSEGPEGSWERVSDIPLPSLGDERSGSSYTFYDARPAAGAALRYRLVAVTRDGLRVSGPTLVVSP